MLKRHLVAQPATLAAHPTPLPAHAAAVAAGAAPFQPRLVYYNDAHHFSAKRIEPPIAVHDLYRPVDVSQPPPPPHTHTHRGGSTTIAA